VPQRAVDKVGRYPHAALSGLIKTGYGPGNKNIRFTFRQKKRALSQDEMFFQDGKKTGRIFKTGFQPADIP
jgi:hypothetical protein